MLRFITDLHLGQSLKSHTTFQSRQALKQELFNHAFRTMSEHSGDWIIGGDLFHDYSNDENIIFQGNFILELAQSCLAGNHDMSNREDSQGSLQLLNSFTDKMVVADIGKSGFYENHFATSETVLTLVPHHSSQELFERALENAMDSCMQIEAAGTRILVLHCNYESPWEKTDTTLNLTEEDAKILLQTFDYIMVGHEHNARTALDDRVIIMGNHHPTSFHDISNKFTYRLEDNKICSELIWNKTEGYAELEPFSETDTGQVQFIEVKGEVTPEEHPKFVKWFTALWKKSPKAFAIKNSVTIKTVASTHSIDSQALESLPDTIRGELKGSDLLELFDELVEEIGPC